MTQPDIEQIIEVLKAARGCGCCSSYEEAEALWPDTCPRGEWGIDHRYDDHCTQSFDTIVRKALGAIHGRGYGGDSEPKVSCSSCGGPMDSPGCCVTPSGGASHTVAGPHPVANGGSS